MDKLLKEVLMIDELSIIETDKVNHTVKIDMLKVVVEVECFGKCVDEFDKKPVLDNDVWDKVLWKTENGKLCKFSVKQAYEDLLEGDRKQIAFENVTNEIRPNVEKKAFAGESSRVNRINDHRNSYTFAVKQKAMHLGGKVHNKPSIVLDDSCILQCDCSLSLMGKVQDFGSLSNLKIILAKEGFDNLILKYLGVFWVQIDCRSKPALEKFKSHVGGGLLYEEDKENLCLNSKRVCIKTTFKDNIFESFKIIVRGKVHWVRAKEVSGWVPDFMEDGDVEDESDEEIIDVGPKEGDGNLNKNNTPERDSDIDEVPETIFDHDHERPKQTDDEKDAEKSGSTFKYAPGFTPVEDVKDNSDYEDKSIREENASNLKSHEEKDMSQRKNRKSMSSSKEEDKASGCSGHFKRAEGPQSGGSILQLLDNLVKNGEVVIMGDFNEVRSKEERHGTLFNVHGSAAFNSFISLGGLVEVPLGGLMGSCPNISAITLDRYLSDHHPILLCEVCFDYGPIPFRLYHYWFEWEGFDKLVEETWSESRNSDSNAISKFMKKLKFLKEKNRLWTKAKKESSNI
ncbi:RNA-directed DNA polymerase, eukaryota [Tanacetum coccineum]